MEHCEYCGACSDPGCCAPCFCHDPDDPYCPCEACEDL